ncbi:MAG: heme-binding protein [Gammaproteobacteria bacterium]|nr:heme-binding protein [Gammaproteobacteria bacterium]
MRIKIAQANIHWEAAHAIVGAAVEKAQSMQRRVNVTVVDRGGHLAAFLRMPGAPFHSIDVARDKAYTAVSFGFATSGWAKLMPGFSDGVRIGLGGRKGLAMFGGGVPIEVGGEVIGAVGVSGASESEDEEIALAGLAAIGAGT